MNKAISSLVVLSLGSVSAFAMSDAGNGDEGSGNTPGVQGTNLPNFAQAEPAQNGSETVPPEVSEDEMAALMETGEQHYQDYCAACHADNGRGDVGPSLTSNAKLADPAYVYKQISEGAGEMPGFVSVLEEEDILAVGTYLRNSWGNEFGALTSENVLPNDDGAAAQ